MSFGLRSRRRSTASGVSLFAALLMVLMLAVSSVPAALAQDATPAAEGECIAPEVPEGTPEPMPEMGGSPEAMDMASPEASPAASPAAEEPPMPPTGEVVEDEDVIDEASAGILNIYACFNEGNFLGGAALLTEKIRIEFTGSANVYTAAAALEGFLGDNTFDDVTIKEVLDLGDGRLAVDNSVTLGKQRSRTLDVLVEEDGFLKLDETYELAPETTENSVTVGLQAATDESEYAFALTPASIPAQPAVIIHLFNIGEMEHEAVIFQTPEDFDPISLLEAEGPEDLPEGVEFIGAGFVPVGGTTDLLLVDLEPGTYTIYCFIPAPDGEPHAAKGMITQLTITEAADVDVPDISGGSPEATPED